jgi:hypothetical protein
VAETPEQGRQVRSGDMIADPEAQPGRQVPRDPRQGALMRLQESPCCRQEQLAFPGRGHVPGRPVEQPRPEPILQTLEPQTDRCLRSVEGFGRPGEATQIDHPHEGQHAVEVEGTE